MKGLSKDLQIALKSIEKFGEKDINELSDETTRLEIAGVKSGTSINLVSPQSRESSDAPKETDIVESITQNVIERLKSVSTSEEVNFNNYGRSRQPNGNNNRNRHNGNRNNRRGSFRGNNQENKKCRVCESSSHFFRNCPVRFCQACGGKGHDAWNESCPNYK